MFTNKDEYTRLLEAYTDHQQAAKYGITREYAAAAIGRSIYYDLYTLASSPAHSHLISDFFSSLRSRETIAMHDIVNELSSRTAGISLQSAEHAPARHIYDISQELASLFDKAILTPSGARVNRNTLDRLDAYLNELKELQNKINPLRKRIDTYYEYLNVRGKNESGHATLSSLAREQELYRILNENGFFRWLEEIETTFANITAKYSDLSSMLGIYTAADEPFKGIYEITHRLNIARTKLSKEYELFNTAVRTAMAENKVTTNVAGVKGLEPVYADTTPNIREVRKRLERLRTKALRNISRTVEVIISPQISAAQENAIKDLAGQSRLKANIADIVYTADIIDMDIPERWPGELRLPPFDQKQLELERYYRDTYASEVYSKRFESFDDLLKGHALKVAEKGGQSVLVIDDRPVNMLEELKGERAREIVRTYRRQAARYQSILPVIKTMYPPDPPDILHGEVTGTPGQVKASIESARGVDSLRQYTAELDMYDAGDTEDAVEAISKWRGEAGGMEAIRAGIGKRFAEELDRSYKTYRVGQELTPREYKTMDYTAEWQVMMSERGRRLLRVPGSAVPYEVVSVNPEKKVATIKPVSISARDVSATITLTPGISATMFNRILKNNSEVSQLAKEIEFAAQTGTLAKAVERVASVVAGNVQVADINRIISGAASSGGNLVDMLHKIAIAYAPWAASQIEKDELANMSMLATYEAIKAYPGDIVVAEKELSADVLRNILGHEEARKTYGRALLGEIFNEIKSSNDFNSVASLINYIKENMHVLESPALHRELTDVEAARLLRSIAEEMVGREAGNMAGTMHHLKHISSMNTAEILGEIIKSSKEVPASSAEIDLNRIGHERAVASHEHIITNMEAVNSFLRKYRDLTADLEAAESIEEARRIMDRLTERFTSETGLGQGELMNALRARFGGVLVPGVEYPIDLSGLDESTALRRIESLLSLGREFGGALEVNFFAGEDKQPITITHGTHDIIAVNQLTNRRYVVGPARAITETTTVEPVDLSRFFEKYENRVLEEVRGIPVNKLTIVRSPGVNFKNLITSTGRGREFYIRDIPDIPLSALHKLRTMKPGTQRVLVGFDWETTTLPGGNLPFYPTEVGIVAEKLKREFDGGFSRENLISENILFKPSQEVARALEETVSEITAAGINNNVSINVEQFHFLRNMAKFADSEILRLTSANEVNGRVEMDGKIARRLIRAANSGFEYLSKHGLEFDEGLARLTELMKQARKTGGSKAILFGQNVLRAEYEWSRIFAGMARTPKIQMEFNKEVEKLFDLPRAELIILDKLMQVGRLGSSAAEAQVERYVRPVLQAGKNVPVSTANIIKELGISGDVAHRGLEDIKTELAILYSHVGRELPITADLRPIRAGGYVARHKIARAGGAYSSAEEGRPVRDVFKYEGIIEDKGRYRIVLNKVELGEGGKLVETGAMEFIHAPNMLELARRFHEQYEYLPGERAARQIYNEFVEDYARREVLKAARQADKLGELVAWTKYGLPEPYPDNLESRPAVILSRGYAAAKAKLESGETLMPFEELLFGAGYERPRDASVYSRPALGSAEFITEELSGTRAGRLRRRAWPYVTKWIESPEGLAYSAILEEAARYRAIGVLNMPGHEIMKQMEKVRKEFIASHGLTPARVERRGIYSLGRPQIPGIDTEEIIITASSPERIERRIRSFLTRTAEKAGRKSDEVFAGLVRHLEQAGAIPAGIISPSNLSTELYQAAIEGKLSPVTVEARHIPVINTPELSGEFVKMARREVLFPNLENVGEEEAESISRDEVERRISEHPVLSARARKYQQAMSELADMGLAGVHLHPAVKIPVLTAGIPGEELVFDDIGLKSPELVEQLYNKVNQIRGRAGGRIRMSKLRYEHGLNSLINALSSRLRSEVYVPTHSPEAWLALGWPSPEAPDGTVVTQDAIIPVAGPPELERDIFMRRVGEFTTDELEGIANVLQGESSVVARKTGRMIERYVREHRLRQKPQQITAAGNAESAVDMSTGSTVRDINESIKREAAERSIADGRDKSAVRGLNEAIKEEAAKRQAQRQVEVGDRTLKADLEAIGHGLARNWKLIAGLGLAGLGLSMILKPRDRDETTSEDSRAYTSGKKGPALRPPAEEAYPKARAIPVEEKGAPGLRIKVRGRSRGNINHGAVSDAIGATVNDTLGINTNINIHTQDDRRAVNEQSVKDMFSRLLKYGYIN